MSDQFKEAIDRAGIMHAFGGGKTIESKSKRSTNWQEDYFPSWNWEEFDYRVKREEKWRPFQNAEELPYGNIRIRAKEGGGWSSVIGAGKDYLVGCNGDKLFSDKFSNCFASGDEISLDGGKTWQPCGVKVS